MSNQVDTMMAKGRLGNLGCGVDAAGGARPNLTGVQRRGRRNTSARLLTVFVVRCQVHKTSPQPGENNETL